MLLTVVYIDEKYIGKVIHTDMRASVEKAKN